MIVIVGGGMAGLWLCDALRRRGDAVLLLESAALGTGQSIGSQGIIHGGVKYALAGTLTESAANIGDMPGRWLASLAGHEEPDLHQAPLRAAHCHLWQTAGLSSGLGMLGARLSLEVTPAALEPAARPEALRDCPGTVARLDEPVVDVGAVLAVLARRNRDHLVLVDRVEMERQGGGDGPSITMHREGLPAVRVGAGTLVLTAGQGNAELRKAARLDRGVMQRRPLHMVMVRGALPELNGHCIDGGTTRATITTVSDTSGRTVWLVGGLVAEQGVAMTSDRLIVHAREELEAILPGVALAGAEWATWRVDRAERATPGGRRPDDVQWLEEGRVITAWPTKLALVPRLVDRLLGVISRDTGSPPLECRDWPRPEVALPPWEVEAEWTTVD